MAKKKIARVIVAEEKVAGIVDRGFEIDVNLKNFKVEDAGIKKVITDVAESLLEEGETSLSLKGEMSTANVVAVEKYELDCFGESFKEVKNSLNKGLYDGVVKEQLSLLVPPNRISDAFALLVKAGMLDVSVETMYTVNPEEYRVYSQSSQNSKERQEAQKALKGCVSCKKSFRVSFEKN